MFKKMGFLALLIVGGLVLLRTTVGAVAWTKARSAFEKQVTPETKLEVIREEISRLGKDTKKWVTAVAEETVAVDNLREQVQVAEKNQKEMLEQILVMKKDVESGASTKIVYNGETFSVPRIQAKLSRDWESYKRGEETLKTRKQLLETKENALFAAKERLGEMRGRREQLELQLAQLDAEIKNVRLSQARNEFQFDDSRFGSIQKSMQEVRDWVKTQKVEAELMGKYSDDPIKVTKKQPESSDVLKEIDSYVGSK